MPFVVVHGIPSGTDIEVLWTLRRSIVSCLSTSMRLDEDLDKPIPPHWIRPFFPADLLDEPTGEEDGAKTIYARIDTAMFSDLPHYAALPAKVAEKLAQVIWDAFEGTYEVEVFVGELHAKWKKLLPAKE